jgi:xanthine/uracil permease
MKNFSWYQVKGLAWFFLVYALSRLLLSMPDMKYQFPESFAVFLGAMTIAWLVYTSHKSQKEFSLLAASLFAACLWIFIYFGHFDKVEIMLSLALIGGFSFITLVVFLVQAMEKLLKRQQNMLWPIIIQFMATTIFIVALEYLLPTIKSLVS